MSVIRQLKRVLGIANKTNMDSVRLSDAVDQTGYSMNLLGYVQTEESVDFVGVRENDFRNHLAVFGQAGFGRQTLLQNSIYQLVNKGQGVCLIDRNGETVEVIEDSVPKDDVAVVKPGHPSESVGFNFFEISKEVGDKNFEEDVEYIISEFVKLTEIDTGDRMKAVTELIVGQLLYDKETYSPRDFQQIISSTDTVQDFVDSFEDSLSQNEVELLSGISEDDLEPIRRRITPFVENDSVATVTSHDSTSMTISEAVEDNMSILVSLGDVKDEHIREYVAASITRKVWAAIQKRSHMGSDKYDSYSLALSNFGGFENKVLGLDEILPRARAFNLSVLVSAQQPGELTEQSMSSIQNNCSNTVSTRIGSESGTDSEVVADMLLLEDETDLMSLDTYRFIGIVSMREDDPETVEFQCFEPLQ